MYCRWARFLGAFNEIGLLGWLIKTGSWTAASTACGYIGDTRRRQHVRRYVRTTWRFSRHVLSVLFWRKINTIARLSASSLLSSAIDAFARWPTAEEKWQRMKITAQLADLSVATWLARHIPAGRGNESVPKIVIDNKTNLFSNTAIRILLISDTVSECWMIKLLPYILFEKYSYILALEMTSTGNQHLSQLYRHTLVLYSDRLSQLKSLRIWRISGNAQAAYTYSRTRIPLSNTIIIADAKNTRTHEATLGISYKL